MDSILTSIKQMLGVAADDTSFDLELVIHINNALYILDQLGIGPDGGLKIHDATETWSLIFGSGVDTDMAKQVVYFRVRMSFDPPQSSFLLESMKKQCDELEWRLEVAGPSPEN